MEIKNKSELERLIAKCLKSIANCQEQARVANEAQDRHFENLNKWSVMLSEIK